MRGRYLPQLINEKYKGDGTRLGPGNRGLKGASKKMHNAVGDRGIRKQQDNSPTGRTTARTFKHTQGTRGE